VQERLDIEAEPLKVEVRRRRQLKAKCEGSAILPLTHFTMLLMNVCR
jgi:hypothetical protein